MWEGTFPKSLSKDSITMSPTSANAFNRWTMFPRAALILMPSGSLYAWSMWQSTLAVNLGVLAPSALDWGFAELGFTWSIWGLTYTASCVLFGLWMDRAGVRYAASASALIFGGGHLIAALGCYTHHLPLIWFGYGALTAIGCAGGYIAPITMLMKWFPDKRGIASGVACSLYAAGGMLTPFGISYFQRLFFKVPTYVGPVGSVETKLEAGKTWAHFEGEWCEAVVATAEDLAKVGQSQLLEGLYMVGTGDAGCMMALVSLGAVFSGTISLGGLLARLPPEGWTPPGWSPAVVPSAANAGIGSVPVRTAVRSPQLYGMFLTSGCAMAPGLFLMSSAHIYMSQVYGTIYPNIVTPTFLAMYVSSLNLLQMFGKLVIGTSADRIGCKNAYFICCLSLPLCLLAPRLSYLALDGSMGVVPLYVFYGASAIIVSLYGGSQVLNPAYVAEVFGPKYAGGIYSQVAATWGISAAAIQSLLGILHTRSTQQAIDSLAAVVPPSAFQEAFNAPMSSLPELVDAKAVTVARLMEIAPPGTLHPAPFLFDTTFYATGGIVVGAAVSNALLHKMDEKHFEKEDEGDDASIDAAQCSRKYTLCNATPTKTQ